MARAAPKKTAKPAAKPRAASKTTPAKAVKSVKKKDVVVKKEPAKKPAPTPAPRAVTPPPPPKPQRTEAERRADLAVASEAMRQRVWGAQGQPLTTVERVTIASALITKGKPHWHLLTFGLAVTGFELSLRVLKQKDELAAPAWAVNLLSALITRAKSNTLTPDPNQVLLLAEGVAPGADSELKGLLFTLDPEAGSLVTPHETVPVLLVVPVTAEEARAVREWSPSGMVDVLSRAYPLLVSDLERPSLLSSPRARAIIDQRMDKEGSSLSSMTASTSTFAKEGNLLVWKLSVDGLETFISLLKGRIAHLRPFSVVSEAGRVEVVNADKPSAELTDKKVLTLKLSLVGARQIRSLLREKPGSYTFELLPGFSLTVV